MTADLVKKAMAIENTHRWRTHTKETSHLSKSVEHTANRHSQLLMAPKRDQLTHPFLENTHTEAQE